MAQCKSATIGGRIGTAELPRARALGGSGSWVLLLLLLLLLLLRECERF